MELLAFSDRKDAWVAYTSVLQGLRASTISSGDILLLSENPGVEVADLSAFFELFAAVGGETERVRVASSCPSFEWIRTVRSAGYVKVFYLAVDGGPGSRIIGRDSLVEVPRDICPALHVRLFDGRPTSVCGNRLDRLVLGPRWISSQCFGRWSECRWAVAARAATHADRREESCTSSSSDAGASARLSPKPAPAGETTWSSSTPIPDRSGSWGRGSTASRCGEPAATSSS